MIEGLKTVAEAVKPVVNEVGKRAIDAFEKPIDSDKRLEVASDSKSTYSYDGLSKFQEILAQVHGFPKELAKDIYNHQELKHYVDIGMRAVQFGQKENGEPRFCLVPKELSLDVGVDEKGRTNAERLQSGLQPIKDGKVLEAHHIGQKNGGHYALLTKEEHIVNGNKIILHKAGRSEVGHDSDFARDKRAIAKALMEGQV
ncbi:HNH/ENDO VII family nuclease [Streptococcus suis]|uniref:HNH/ENDO VII family nuclease n=1 Tax=Streptococcus suis TaxID=1307 RepID=UPI00211D3B4E|nr:HNH/ENDO VII family nuclease [Streptococcus suis]UUM57565.1 HNH/ENDO VII family nuclease [Streptococcus suis]